MSGQSANLSLKEARALQCRVQAPGSQADKDLGASRKSIGGKMKHEHMKKAK